MVGFIEAVHISFDGFLVFGHALSPFAVMKGFNDLRAEASKEIVKKVTLLILLFNSSISSGFIYRIFKKSFVHFKMSVNRVKVIPKFM